RRRRGAAGRVRGDRDPQPPSPATGAAAARPHPHRRLPQLRRGRHLHLPAVLFSHPVYSGHPGIHPPHDPPPPPPPPPPAPPPSPAAVSLRAGPVAQLVPKTGARPLLLAGSAAAAGGLYWLSQITEHDTYATAVLGPTLVIGAGAALLFVTLSLVALNRVPEADSGVASSLLNTGQQPAAPAGRALLAPAAWTVA